MVNQAVYIYNNLRPHLSLELKKPAEVHINPTVPYKSYKRNKKQLKPLLI